MNDTYDDEMLDVEEAYGKYKFYKFKFLIKFSNSI